MSTVFSGYCYQLRPMFDGVSHYFICNKLYNVGSDPHVTNWLISFSVKENKGLWGMNFLPTT